MQFVVALSLQIMYVSSAFSKLERFSVECLQSAKAQQSPYETKFHSLEQDFYSDLHQIAHTQKYQTLKYARFFYTHELFSYK